MSGTLPSTYYLIEYKDKIIGRGGTLSEAYENITNHYFEVTDNGRITLNRSFLPGPSYFLEEFTKEEALKDWFRCYARKALPYTVHRSLRDW